MKLVSHVLGLDPGDSRELLVNVSGFFILNYKYADHPFESGQIEFTVPKDAHLKMTFSFNVIGGSEGKMRICLKIMCAEF